MMNRLSLDLARTLMAAGAILLASCAGGSRPDADQPASDRTTSAGPIPGGSASDPVPVETVSATVPLDRIEAGVGRLSGGASSPEALIGRALTALAARDTAALRSLAITEQEWRLQLYPEFPLYYPAASDTREETKAFLWQNHVMNSTNAMLRSLRAVGGKKMKLVSIAYRDQDQTFKTYTLHQGTAPTVLMTDGEKRELKLFGSIVEKDGVYKLMSFRDRD